jgi:hypothetical protein
VNIIRATLDKLAGVLACREDQAEDVLRSEASARASFSRRGLFKAAGAVAAGVVLAEALPEDPSEGYEFRLTTYPQLVNRAPSSLRSLDAFLKERWGNSETAKALRFPAELGFKLDDPREAAFFEVGGRYVFGHGDRGGAVVVTGINSDQGIITVSS